MKFTSFDEYLRVKHMEYEPGLTSDMYVDAFEDWIVEQDPNDIIEWAEKYGEIVRVQTEIKTWKEAKKVVEDILNLEKEL